MRSAQPVNNRIMELSQSVADLLQNPKCFSSCQSFSTNKCNCPTPFNQELIDSGVCNRPGHFNESVNPACFNNEAVNRFPEDHCKHFNRPINPSFFDDVQINTFPHDHCGPVSPGFNEPVSSIPCDHHKHFFEPVSPVFNGGPCNPPGPFEPVSPAFAGPINPIPCGHPIEPVSPIAGEHTKSFTNLGTFINLGTFFNNCSESDFCKQHGPCPEIVKPVDLCQPCECGGPIRPDCCCHPDLLDDLINPIKCKKKCFHPGPFNNLFNKLDFLNHYCCHSKFHHCFADPDKFRRCPIKSHLIIAFELAKGSVRALPLRLFRKKEILEVLERAEKLICEAPCLSIELINSVLTLLQLASLKVTQFTNRRCFPSNVFVATSSGCSSKSFSTQCCSFR